MTRIVLTKVEEQQHGRVLFDVRAFTSQGRIDLSIGVLRGASPAFDEETVLRAVLDVSQEIAAAIRLRLSSQNALPSNEAIPA